MEKANRFKTGSAPVWTESTDHFSSVFDDFMRSDDSRRSFENSGVSTPAVNIIETREHLLVEMVAPGMKKEAFKVTLEDQVLTISYDHEDNREGERKDWKYRMREYNYHSFVRSFVLPDTVESDQTEAQYKDGILNLRIPKRKDAITRQIPIA